jgi:outer membrane protein assembly factor BamB
MLPASLALALATATAGLTAHAIPQKLPPVPRSLYRIAWHRPLVPTEVLDYLPMEAGGVAVDERTSTAVFGTRDGWLHAIRPNRAFVWEHQTKAGFAGPPTVSGSIVYVGTRDGRLYGIDVATGRPLWKYDTKEELGTRPAVAKGVVYVASLQDTVFAVDAQTGAWKWHHRREGRPGFSIRGQADVVTAEGLVFAGFSDGTVAALDAATGRPAWERVVAPPGEQVDVDGLALEGGRLYAAAYSGAVLALDPKTGSQLWSAKVAGAHKLIAANGVVYAVGSAEVVALSSADGGRLWASTVGGGWAASPPVLVGRWLVVPAGEGGLRWLEAASGRTLRVFDPGMGVSGEPARLGARVYVLSNGGDLFALDLR